jgi:hypothetical protein
VPLKYPSTQVPKYPKKSKPRMTNSAAGAFFSSFRAWAFRVSLGTWVFGYLMARTINVVHAKEAYLSAIRTSPFISAKCSPKRQTWSASRKYGLFCPSLRGRTGCVLEPALVLGHFPARSSLEKRPYFETVWIGTTLSHPCMVTTARLRISQKVAKDTKGRTGGAP